MEMISEYFYEQPEKLIVIGDLNGDCESLICVLRGLSLIDDAYHWCAQNVHLVQLGDLVNRGAAPRRAFDILSQLEKEARHFDSHIHMLLGNHEVMVTLNNLAWCEPDEFLEFATQEDIFRYDNARARKTQQLLESFSRAGAVLPLTGALRAWEDLNVPGKEAYRLAMGVDGHYGKLIRRLPLALKVGEVILTHGGLLPSYSRLGLEQLHQLISREWATRPTSTSDLHYRSPLLDEEGPLWSRRLAVDESPATRAMLEESLDLLSASLMVVGHTRTDYLGGERGQPLALHDGQLICADVGIGQGVGSPAAVVIESDTIYSWRPELGKRFLGRLQSRNLAES
jgi:hypothetical protein